jgi:hypothetical protein
MRHSLTYLLHWLTPLGNCRCSPEARLNSVQSYSSSALKNPSCVISLKQLTFDQNCRFQNLRETPKCLGNKAKRTRLACLASQSSVRSVFVTYALVVNHELSCTLIGFSHHWHRAVKLVSKRLSQNFQCMWHTLSLIPEFAQDFNLPMSNRARAFRQVQHV